MEVKNLPAAPALLFINLAIVAVLFVALRSQTLTAFASDQPLADNRNESPPELVGKNWLNTDKPIQLRDRKGKVTVVEFWTFACSNCRANLPAYSDWQREFSGKGVAIIGVHTPESDFERDAANVAKFVKRQNIQYPVLLDEDWANWHNWKQQYWPAIYLIDKKGKVRFLWTGELGAQEEQVTKKIRDLLNEP